jgi:NAD(P)-dependent dehydrogenase (short-subunit alcohol dehydrogenase family)
MNTAATAQRGRGWLRTLFMDYRPLLVERPQAPAPMRRASQADELAAVIAFLASSRLSYTTGTAVAADGGR